MLCRAGDVAVCNRQVLHGSFANTSADPRATLVFGFHRRSSVLGVQGWGGEIYSEQRIARRSRVIALAIEARRRANPGERSYDYAPCPEPGAVDHEGALAPRDYNLDDLGI